MQDWEQAGHFSTDVGCYEWTHTGCQAPLRYGQWHQCAGKVCEWKHFLRKKDTVCLKSGIQMLFCVIKKSIVSLVWGKVKTMNTAVTCEGCAFRLKPTGTLHSLWRVSKADMRWLVCLWTGRPTLNIEQRYFNSNMPLLFAFVVAHNFSVAVVLPVQMLIV